MAKYYYLLVTQDEYELPLAVADSIDELADIVGVKRNIIDSALSHSAERGTRKNKRGRRSKYRKVKRDD